MSSDFKPVVWFVSWDETPPDNAGGQTKRRSYRVRALTEYHAKRVISTARHDAQNITAEPFDQHNETHLHDYEQ